MNLKKVKSDKKPISITVNEFLKIKDIRGDFLYTTDNFIVTYIQVFPENTRLKTQKEQGFIALNLARELSMETESFGLFLTNRPVDVSKMTDYQAELMMKETDTQIQALLQKRIEGLNTLSNTGIALEEEIYLKIWTRDKEGAEDLLNTRKNRLSVELLNAGFKTKFLTEKELQQLCDSFTNPETTTEESQDYYHLRNRIDYKKQGG
ncbi:MAG: hypothetical protein J6A89_01740 [Clostridia bacterium]|nr:hypothetical protein [Clostridia bacterium]